METLRIISLCGYFRHSRAEIGSCGPIWSKFELLLDITHVLNTYTFKKDQINSKREKVATSIFKHPMAANPVVHSQIWPNFNLT